MKDYIKQLLEKTDNEYYGQYIIRDYLQARILNILQNKGTFSTWAFIGGTALRFLYSIPRFSEDIDFSLTKSGEHDRFEQAMEDIKMQFAAENYNINTKIKSNNIVKKAFIKFEGLLHEFGFTPHQEQMFTIKIELDTNPPEGAEITSTIIRKYVLLNLQHYDKSSLLSGKLHAILARKYTKGRDIYDLFWYLSDSNWPIPNLTFLNNALKQTSWQGEPLSERNWKDIIKQKLKTINWKQAIEDVRPFLEDPEELKLLTMTNLIKQLNK